MPKISQIYAERAFTNVTPISLQSLSIPNLPERMRVFTIAAGKGIIFCPVKDSLGILSVNRVGNTIRIFAADFCDIINTRGRMKPVLTDNAFLAYNIEGTAGSDGSQLFQALLVEFHNIRDSDNSFIELGSFGLEDTL